MMRMVRNRVMVTALSKILHFSFVLLFLMESQNAPANGPPTVKIFSV